MHMTTLLIGMALAFVLGAMTAILPLWLSNPDLFKRTYSASVVGTSKELKEYPMASNPKEKTPEEIKREAYLEQIANMLDYDGKKQVGAE